ncbi:MAG TPA: molybdopterin-dependent oxidoreductase [Candidatus Nanopelagicaceae bacterium]|nr:molybdopterin-dependent oxidoreductase [Candidatus Nanopelagicaceae bacterium]
METQENDTIDDGEKIIRTTTAFDCGGRCPLRVHVKDGKVIRIEGDDFEDKDEQLRACLRCRALRQYIYHPDRLKFPLKRDGPKGSGKYKRISWDEALSEIAAKLKEVKEKYGNSSIFLATGGGYQAALHDGMFAMIRLLTQFGGFSTHFGNISSEGAVYATQTQYTSPFVGHSRTDLKNSKLIIMWGWDPARMISGSDTIYNLIKAKEKGIKIICIDPRYTDSAVVLADQWIPIIPGTDTAMMVAMAYVMIKENLHDQEFLDKYTIGFEKFVDYVMGEEDGIPKTPEWAEQITSVPAEIISNLAREYATTKPAAFMDCQGPARSAVGELYNRCAMTLTAMTGNVGKHGGSAAGGLMGIPYGHMFFASRIPPPYRNPVETGLKSVRGSLDLQLRFQARCHTNKMFDAILKGKGGGYPFDVKFAWFVNNNFLNQLGNTNKAAEALKKLDYMVCAELWLTPTARYADIVLPVTSAAEKNDFTRPWPSGPYFTAMNQAIEPIGECKSDLRIAEELADKLGLEEFVKYPDEKKALRFLIKLREDTRKNIRNINEFREKGIHRIEIEEPYVAFKEQIDDIENKPFKTPSGKIEIFSQRIADLNDPENPPIPKYMERWEGRYDPLSEKYPLQLLSPHPKNRVHSELYLVEWLREVDPHVAWINPVDAESRGIRDGDEILVYNDRGKLTIKAWLTERIIPGAISIFEGAWYDPDENGIDRGGCVNTLTKDAYSPGGASALKSCLVEIKKYNRGA